MIKHYKEKFWNLSNDELKDIIAGTFREYSNEEVTAAIELLKERSSSSGKVGGQNNSDLPLAQIPAAPMATLLQIVKNPHLWSQDAVDIAEAEIFRREQAGNDKSQGGKNNTMMQGILAVVGVVLSVILIKLVFAMFILIFFFYAVLSCLNDLPN